MKHKHILTANKVDEKCSCYIYNYGSTKGIRLIIAPSGFQISVELGKTYNLDELLRYDAYLFPDAIKKALLLFCLKYSRSLDIKTITLLVDKKESTKEFNNNPLMSSLIEGSLFRSIPFNFQSNNIASALLNTTKSKPHKLTASLYAYLFSKSKKHETERFVYLWIAFNGIYRWISDFIAKANKIEYYRKENKQIIGMQQFLSVGKGTINDSEKTRIANEVSSILKEYKGTILDRKSIEKSELQRQIYDVLDKKYDLTPYGYLLTQFSYYYRCKIIHGSKPLLLFSHRNDMELICITVINNLLENYIDENLPLFFSQEYIKSNVIPKTKHIILV